MGFRAFLTTGLLALSITPLLGYAQSDVPDARWKPLNSTPGNRVFLDQQSIQVKKAPFVRYSLRAELLQDGQVAAEIHSAHTANCKNGFDQVNASSFRSMDGSENIKRAYTTRTPFRSGMQAIVTRVCQEVAARQRNDEAAQKARASQMAEPLPE